MPEQPMAWRARWPEVVAACCVAAVLIGHLIALPQLGMTSEDTAWEAFFRERSLSELWCTPHGSYRPTCGALLHWSAPLPWRLKIALSGALHLLVAGLAGGLAWRIAGRRAGFWTACVPLVWSTQAEVVLWLGGRCELMWVVPGLLGAHSLQSGTSDPRWRWPLLTTLCCVLAALGKEPGFLLPTAYAPLLVGCDRKQWIRQLAPSVIALAGVLLVRSLIMRGAGAYVGTLFVRGPIDWAGNLALAYTKLALGSTIRWPNWLSVIVPLVGAAVALFVGRRFDRRSFAVTVGALFILMAPTALVHAPRTLYGSVVYVGIALGVALLRRPPLRPWLAAALILHTAAALAGQSVWTRVWHQREDVVSAALRASNDTGHRVLLLGLRWRPYGVPAAVVVRGDFDAPVVVDPLLAVRYAENELDPMREVGELLPTDCRVTLDYVMPPGPPVLPPGVHLLGRDPVMLQFSEPVVILYSHDGRLERAAVPCGTPPSLNEREPQD